MRRTQIRAGEVYALTAKHCDPVPVAFLEPAAAGLWERQPRRRQGTPATFLQIQEDENTRAGTTESQSYLRGDCGYLIARPWRRTVAGEDPLPALRALVPEAELERLRTGKPPSSPLLCFDVATTLRGITDWDEAVHAADQRNRELQEWFAAADAASERVTAAVSALQALGVTARAGVRSGTMELVIDDAERLLTMLGGDGAPGTRREPGQVPQPARQASAVPDPGPRAAAGPGSRSGPARSAAAGRGTGPARPLSSARDADRRRPQR